MSDSRPSSFWFVVLTLALLLATAGGIIAFLPLVECVLDPYLVYTDLKCPYCEGKGRRTLLSCWRLGAATSTSWEGRTVRAVLGLGFTQSNFPRALKIAGIHDGMSLTNTSRIAAAKALLATGDYLKVGILAEPNPMRPGNTMVTITVVEKPALKPQD